jgi:hypothetical protein
MVQRSSTYVMTSENGLDVLMKGVYEEDGVNFTSRFYSNPAPLTNLIDAG